MLWCCSAISLVRMSTRVTSDGRMVVLLSGDRDRGRQQESGDGQDVRAYPGSPKKDAPQAADLRGGDGFRAAGVRLPVLEHELHAQTNGPRALVCQSCRNRASRRRPCASINCWVLNPW